MENTGLLWEQGHNAHVHDTEVLQTIQTEAGVHDRLGVGGGAHLDGACHVPDGADAVLDPRPDVLLGSRLGGTDGLDDRVVKMALLNNVEEQSDSFDDDATVVGMLENMWVNEEGIGRIGRLKGHFSTALLVL